MEYPPLPSLPDAADIPARAFNDRVWHHLVFPVGKDRGAARLSDWRLARCHAICDQIVLPWFRTTLRINDEGRKRFYDLSMKCLIGRLLQDAIGDLGLEDTARSAMSMQNVDYDEVLQDEPDAALGIGGLGRLATCFLDSMSSVGLTTHGYGIRYHQGLENGWQTEEAQDWLAGRHVWEFERPEVALTISTGWINDSSEMEKLAPLADDPEVDARRFGRTEQGICLVTQPMIDAL